MAPIPGISMMAAVAGAGGGGIQYVGGGAANMASNSGTQSFPTLTGGLASSPSEGDLVVLFLGSRSNTNQDISVTGYTELFDLYADDINDANLGLYYKFMTSTPDTSFTYSRGTSSGGYAMQVWRGVNSATPMDVAGRSATGTNSYLPNPPSITPVSGGAIIVAAGVGAHDGRSAVFSSSQLSNFVGANAEGDVSGYTLGMGSYEWSGGAFDPFVFTSSGSDTASGSWCAATIALRP